MFWGDPWQRTKRLLFAPDSPIFREAKDRKAFLALAAETADGQPVLTSLRMLGTQHLVSADP